MKKVFVFCFVFSLFSLFSLRPCSCLCLVAQDYFAQGQHDFKVNMPERAIENFLQVLSQKDVPPATYIYLGLSYSQTGQYEKALKTFTKGLDAPGADILVLCYNAGNVCFLQEDYKSAIDWYTKAIAQDATYTNAVLNRANSYLKQDDIENALVDYQSFLSLAPDDTQAANVTSLAGVLQQEIEAKKAQGDLAYYSEYQKNITTEDALVALMAQKELQQQLEQQQNQALQEQIEQAKLKEAQTQRQNFAVILEDSQKSLDASKALDTQKPQQPLEKVQPPPLNAITKQPPHPEAQKIDAQDITKEYQQQQTQPQKQDKDYAQKVDISTVFQSDSIQTTKSQSQKVNIKDVYVNESIPQTKKQVQGEKIQPGADSF